VKYLAAILSLKPLYGPRSLCNPSSGGGVGDGDQRPGFSALNSTLARIQMTTD
jgi:hypothetical protein